AITVILTQFFSAYFYSEGKNIYRKVFSAFILCVSVYLFGYLMIINTSNLQELMLWNQIQYLGLPFISVLWLTVALLYTKTIYTLSRRTAVLLFFVPVITFFMRLTNSWHHFFYKKWEAKQIFGYYSLYMERGCWYYVNISYTILCLFLTIIIYHLGYQKKRLAYTRSQFFIFFFASLFPLIGVMLVLFVYNKWSIDYSALIMPIPMLIIGYGILKYDFLEIKTLARETIFENSFEGLMILESGLRLIDYNKAAKKFFGTLNISLDNYPIELLFKREPELLEIFKSDTTKEFSLVVGGEKRFFEIDTMPLGNPHDRRMMMLKSIRDITEKKKIQEELTILATTDSLSGLYNRAEFMELAQRALSWAKIHNEQLSLLMIDLDFFKNINDTYGHAAGDEIIRRMGNIIKTNFRKTDLAGRLGGEEFAVLLKNTSLQEAKRAAEKFREAVSKTKVIYEKQEINLTVSIGVAVTCGGIDNNSNIEDILKQADNALYKAKAKGRNCIVTMECRDTASM
ncbi:MAG: diguanylate cyclase, partial [Firmicutes bacterium]|nr:diguanylate cyclase [Bacillota bacterium]